MERIMARVGAWAKRVWRGTARRVERMTPREWAAVVVALALWMWTGSMAASGIPPRPAEEGFGAVHWYGGA